MLTDLVLEPVPATSSQTIMQFQSVGTVDGGTVAAFLSRHTVDGVSRENWTLGWRSGSGEGNR
jgi:hypothetical protein